MIVMFVLSDASAAPDYNYDPRVDLLFIDGSSPPNWRGYIYFLICLLTDPVKQRANSRSLLCEPLLVDDGHGIEDLDPRQAQGTRTGTPVDYESLLGMSGFQMTCFKGSRRNWRRGVCWPRLWSDRH